VDASAFASPCIGSAKAQEWAFSGEKFVVRWVNPMEPCTQLHFELLFF
jgi:hypothetical protein